MTMKGPLLLYLPSLLFTVVVILGVGVSIGSVSAQNLRTKTIHLRDRLNEKQEKELLRLLKVDPNGKEQKIVSGFETDETLSWQVQFGDNVCGATLIRDDIVLTAAHCINNAGCPITVDVGNNERIIGGRNVEGVTFDVVEGSCRIHPEFKTVPNRADVAIFKLAKKTNASVITINNDPSIPKLLNDDENMTAYGMGLISNNQGTDSQVLLQVKEKYIEDCTPYLGIFFNDTAMICVNGTQATVDLNGNVIGSGVCQGDSGGPLVYDLNLSSMILPVQVGISSFISNRERCGDARTVDVFTNISTYYNWIQNESDYLQFNFTSSANSASTSSDGGGGCCFTRLAASGISYLRSGASKVRSFLW